MIRKIASGLFQRMTSALAVTRDYILNNRYQAL